jgi:hypothetical protein
MQAKSHVTAAPPSSIPARVAELEAIAGRLVDVQAGLVEALARLAPPADTTVSTPRPRLRVIR